jgi:hypothetical protein
MNYEHGITCRILAAPAAEGWHSFTLGLDLTHSGGDVDLEWILLFSDDRAQSVTARLVAPEEAGGELRNERYSTPEDFKKAVEGLPSFVHGFMAGRASRVATSVAGQ